MTAVAADVHDLPAGAPRFEFVLGPRELRDPKVMDITRDRLGFMWFATYTGLVRYDGAEVRWFEHDPQDASSLSDNRIRGLLPDREGGLWVSTWNVGVNRYDPRTGRFTRYQHDPRNAESLDDNRVRALYEDRQGYFWVGTMSGLNRLDPRTGRVQRYPQLTSEAGQDYAVYAVVEDTAGSLWVGLYGWGLLQISPDGRVLARYRHDQAKPDSLSDNQVTHLVFDDTGTLWVGTWGGGLDAFDPDTGSFRAYRAEPSDDASIPDDYLLKVWSDQNGIWVIPRDGPLARLDPATGGFVRYPHDPRRVGSPTSYLLSGAAFRDLYGSLWLGAYGDGVYVWHPAKSRLIHYQATPGAAGGLSDNLVNAVLQDRRGEVWLGTRRGLNRLDLATGQVTAYQHDPKNPNSLSANFVYALYEDGDGTFWVGTFGSGLNRFDRESGTFQRFPCGTSDPRAISNCEVRDIFEDRSGRLWIGTDDGLNRLDRRSQLVTQYTSRPDDPSSLRGAVHAITESPDGTLWIGTTDGFNRWVPESGTFVRYAYDASDATGLVQQAVVALRARPDGSLWLGTGAGLQLVEWDEKGTPRYTLYAERVGLPRFAVRGILADAAGALWITTSGHGLWNFDPASGRTAQFDSHDGLMNGYEEPGYWLSDGRLLLGGMDGVVIFDTEPITPSWAPPVAVTAVDVDNRMLPGIDMTPGRAAGGGPGVTLGPQNRTISFHFAVLDYLTPARNRFRYRLEGYEDDWSDTTQGQATYTNLAPGTYRFRVIGANAAGVWNEEGAALTLSVQPPWWQTGWFRVFALLVVVGLVLGAHQLRLKYVVDTNRRLVEEIEHGRKVQAQVRNLAGRLITAQEAERSAIARDLHDDVGQRLASLSIGLSRVKRLLSAGAGETLDVLTGLQEQAKALSGDLRRVSHELHPATLEHLGLLRSLRTHCQQFGAQTGLTVRLDVDDTWPVVPAATDLCLYRVAQEALRNVATHAGAARVTISLVRQPGHLVMSIADDGRGFDPTMPNGRTGLGLVSMRERVHTIGGAFDVAAKPGAGTTISISIPIGEPPTGETDAAQSASR